MTTVLEIVDSAVKIGLGALISGIATYLVASRNHAHELRKASLQDRRELIHTAARHLEQATTLINQATFEMQQEGANKTEGTRLIVDAINKLGEARSVAILLGIKKLATAITDLRAGMVQLAHTLGSEEATANVRQVNSVLSRINEAWPVINAELHAAYAELNGAA